jgi:hypothetical protein
MKVHEFATSGEAYDASQTDDGIKDGDVLHVPAEGSAAVLLAAWPTAVAPGYVPDVNGAFGAPLPGYQIEDVIEAGQERGTYRSPGFYAEAIAVARALTSPGEVLKEHKQHGFW